MPAEVLARLARDHFRDVVGPLIRIVGSFEQAEEIAQESFAIALQRWSVDGIPPEPLAWLRRVARNQAIDRFRRSARWQDKAELLLAEPQAAVDTPDPDQIEDDRLRLLFTCCHPALAAEARIALTLHTVCGLTTDEIARAFLVPRATLQQRLVRAKRKIDVAGIPYEVPTVQQMPLRLHSVLQTVYVVFTEGYASTRDDAWVRSDLCDLAIGLARELRRLLPESPEIGALLALMLLHHARTPARLDAQGRLVRLAEQDRALWNRDHIAEALPLVEASLQARPVPRYAIEAAIAALHDRAATAEATDWAQIAALYQVLDEGSAGDPIVGLNHAVAIAMAGDAQAGFDRLDAIQASGALDAYHLFHVARAELLERLGQPEAAHDALVRARAAATHPVEQEFLDRRLAKSSQRS